MHQEGGKIMSITDKESREKILGSSSNVMISAGAGAGKTEIMSKAVIERLSLECERNILVVIAYHGSKFVQIYNY